MALMVRLMQKERPKSPHKPQFLRNPGHLGHFGYCVGKNMPFGTSFGHFGHSFPRQDGPPGKKAPFRTRLKSARRSQTRVFAHANPHRVHPSRREPTSPLGGCNRLRSWVLVSPQLFNRLERRRATHPARTASIASAHLPLPLPLPAPPLLPLPQPLPLPFPRLRCPYPPSHGQRRRRSLRRVGRLAAPVAMPLAVHPCRRAATARGAARGRATPRTRGDPAACSGRRARHGASRTSGQDCWPHRRGHSR